MCGICGIVHRDWNKRIDANQMRSMRDVMVHRGPDDAGLFVAPGIGLGARRLSILDLSDRGRMPMVSADGRYHIVYNGEVYNSNELRTALEARGYAFQSRTDTEVVLYLYAHEGPAMLNRLNGMFAIALWDARDRRLFLARDRLGVKPLYYACDDGTLRFASEQKGLFAAGLAAQFDASVLEELLCFRYVAGERTPFLGVQRLLPGHYLLWKDGAIEIRRWWNLSERVRDLCGRPSFEVDRWYRETFDDAVRLRRISDVPVGVLLSGGLDSGSVAASLASQAGAGVESFTVSFDERRYDEAPRARDLAERWKLKYHELRVPPNELLSRLLEAAWLNDEPLAHGHEAHLRAISGYAKSLVTVLLSGEGADETLGGYVRYRPLGFPGLLSLLQPLSSKAVSRILPDGRIRKLVRLLQLRTRGAQVLFNACNVLPADLANLGLVSSNEFPFRDSMLAEAQALYRKDMVRQAMYLDQHTFLCSLLDRMDRMTMGASIECRVPFLDYRLVEGLAALPTPQLFGYGHGKALLRAAIGQRLPHSVLRQPKWGFGVPWNWYLRHESELRDVVASLPTAIPFRDRLSDRRALERIVHAFLAGDGRWEALVRQLFMINVWYDACIRNPPRTAAQSRPWGVTHGAVISTPPKPG